MFKGYHPLIHCVSSRFYQIDLFIALLNLETDTEVNIDT